jgi:hypothetical protein
VNTPNLEVPGEGLHVIHPPPTPLLPYAESCRGPRARSRSLDLAVARLGCGDQRVDQDPGTHRDFIDGAVKSSVIRLRRAVEPAELSHELE